MRKTSSLLGVIALALNLLAPVVALAAYTGTPPLVVAAGGTGASTLPAFNLLLGNGTAAISGITPSATVGIPVVSAGASANPIYGTASVAGGGTGQVTLAAFGVLIGNGTSGIASVAPSATAGIGLVSQGASANPVYGTTVVAGGGTGQVTLAAHGLLVGEGTTALAVIGPVADSVPVWGAATADPTTAGTASTADSLLGWGAAGSTPAPVALLSCSSGTSALTYNTGTHVFGCNTISAGTGVALTTAAVASTATITLATTNGLTTIVNTGTAATTINLPATQANGWRQCVKDGTENFSTNPATIKVSAGNIDGTVGTTGVAINQKGMELCFISDGTNYWIE